MIWIFYTIPCALNIIGVIVAFYLSYQKLEKSDPFEKIWKVNPIVIVASAGFALFPGINVFTAVILWYFIIDEEWHD